MKKLIAIYLLFAFVSCKKNANSSLPSCIQKKINTLKILPKQTPTASITQYTYLGNKVYYMPASCCDQYNPVYDENCNYLGAPDGGFIGNGDGRLPGFFAAATNPVLIWKDPR